MTTIAAAPAPEKSRGRVIAARATFAVVLLLPWILRMAGGFDDTAWIRGFAVLTAGLVVGTGVGTALCASERTSQVGTGLVRGSLLAFGANVAIVYFLSAIYSD